MLLSLPRKTCMTQNLHELLKQEWQELWMGSGSSEELLKKPLHGSWGATAKPGLPGSLVSVCSTVTAVVLQSICWPGLMNISGVLQCAVLPALPEASRSSPKATSTHLWCLHSRHPLQKYSRRKVQSETHTDQWGGEALGRSECLILAHFSENFLYRKEAQLLKRNPWHYLTVQGARVPKMEDEFSKCGILQWWKDSLQISKQTASFRILQVIL